VGCDLQHSLLIGVVLDRGGNRGRSRPVGVECVRTHWARLAHQPGLLGALVGALGDSPDLLPCRHSHLGWQPSRFLADRAEAERAFALAEQLGSVNAAAAELGTTWPSLPKAFQFHGLGMPVRNPQSVCQRAIDAARQRSGQPARRSLDPVFVALNSGALPAQKRLPAELYEWSAATSSTPPWVPAW
jgi:hypothetical protein